jgi:hypothetical protein
MNQVTLPIFVKETRQQIYVDCPNLPATQHLSIKGAFTMKPLQIVKNDSEDEDNITENSDNIINDQPTECLF